MTMKFVNNNNREHERLRRFVNKLKSEELKLVINKEGWTVATALAHIAFWDQRRLVLIKKWRKSGIGLSPIDEDVTNDSMLPFLLAIPPRKAAKMAITTSETLDLELENLSPDLIKAIKKQGDKHGLDRSIHRKMHLDEIESKLKLF